MQFPSSIITAPSLLAADFTMLASELQKVEKAGGDWLHLDVMDGHFVPNLTFGSPIIQALRPKTTKFFDVHLMVDRPSELLDTYIEAGADAITFHWEADTHHHRTIQRIHDQGKRAGVAFVPSTPVLALQAILPYVDIILVMSINPGFGGQKYLPESTKRIEHLVRLRSEMGLKFQISVDGGVNSQTMFEIVEAGADILVTGSAFFGSNDPAAYVRSIKELRKFP